jgi:hypothetical protein
LPPSFEGNVSTSKPDPIRLSANVFRYFATAEFGFSKLKFVSVDMSKIFLARG